MSIEFTPENKEKLKKIVAKYERAQSAIMPALYLAQEQFGYLTNPVLDYVAGELQVPNALAYEVASFYGMYKKKDWGKYSFQVCNNVTCCMMGSEEIIETLKKELGIGLNEVTQDKVFSLTAVQCLGSCDTGPMMAVNEDYHENLTQERVKEIVATLRSGGTV